MAASAAINRRLNLYRDIGPGDSQGLLKHDLPRTLGIGTRDDHAVMHRQRAYAHVDEAEHDEDQDIALQPVKLQASPSLEPLDGNRAVSLLDRPDYVTGFGAGKEGATHLRTL